MRAAAALALSLALILPPQLHAQDTLADIRQELATLLVEVQRLRRELSTTGTSTLDLSGTSALQRIDTMEAELSRLTGQTEQLTNRVNSLVNDGTNRIGDLQFRVCELEPGCDIAALGETTPLGGTAAPVATPPPPDNPALGELAIGEKADFDRARAVLDQGDFRAAADLFATFTQTYTAGALTGQAHFYRGQALGELGLGDEAARAYLESFSGSPGGELAPEALLQLGLMLNQLGQPADACAILAEVTTRFPQSSASIQAQTARGGLICE